MANGTNLNLVKTRRQGAKNADSQPDTALMLGNKVPPHSNEAEAAVIGAMMLDRTAITKAIEILSPDSFYSEIHKKIYETMLTMFERSINVDILTLSEELYKQQMLDFVGGTYYLTEINSKTPTAANIEYYARIVQEKYFKRALINAAGNILVNAYDESTDALDEIDKAERDIFEIAEKRFIKSYKDIKSLAHDTIDLIAKLAERDHTSMTGVPSGFKEMDKTLGGFQNSDFIIIAARPSMGKCLGKGTRVLMYDGKLKAVEDIEVNDLLMGDDSTPRKVLSIARGREMMYWIRQLHGLDYRVNESHILSLKRSRNDESHKKGEIINIDVKEYLGKSQKWKTNYKGYKVSVDFDYQDVPVDPYLLGLWLGDGKSDNSRIYNKDEEVVEYLHEFADANGQYINVIQDKDKCPAYLITGGRSQKARNVSFQAQLRELGVLNNKHIPQVYLSNNRSIRLQLLAGLIDSDGFINHSYGGTIEITSKFKHLAEQIKFLCDTLGYRTSIKEKIAKISSINYESKVWRVRFNGNVDEIPTLIKRKKGEPWTDYRDWKVTGISVEPDIVDDYFGFEIDGNRLFLLEDCTVLHNTALALSIARNAAVEYKMPVAVFSIEMSNIQLVMRLVSAEAKINAHNIRTGNISSEDLRTIVHKMGRLADSPLYIDDSPSLSMLELHAKCRRLKIEHQIKMVIIDYLQLMHPPGKAESREREISIISRSLKQLAKELDIPIVALAQLNRSVESRNDKRPMLSDLRESGSIEQDADVVLFIHRPEFYGIKTYPDDQSPTENTAEVIIGKQRNGPTGSVKLAYIKNYARFENLELRYDEQPKYEQSDFDDDAPF